MAGQLWVPQLRSSRDTAEQIGILRSIKNELVGHPLKKEAAVTQGVLEPVVRLAHNKSSVRQDSKSHDHSFASKPLTEEETVRLQAVHIIASLAIGGPAFLAPLQAASVLPAINSNICPINNPASLVLASLRALSNLASSSALTPGSQAVYTSSIADSLFARQHLTSICRILSQTSSSPVVQNQIALTTGLISKICLEERHQQALANAGILDALATKLASFVVAEGLVVPGAEALAQRDGLQEHFPLPAPSNANLSLVLEAVSIIIADSKFRASQLLYSPSILAVFPTGQNTDFIANQGARAAWNAFNTPGLSQRQSQLNAVDYLLPFVPLHVHKSAPPSAFPPLGTDSREGPGHNGRSSAHKYNSSSLAGWGEAFAQQETNFLAQETIGVDEEPESPLIAYLIYILRAREGIERLTAASVLTVLYRSGLTSKTRETALSVLVVPLLVALFDDCPYANASSCSSVEEGKALELILKERSPAVLAMLITDNEYLQKAAVDAGAITKLSKLLKLAYDPAPDNLYPPPWSPHVTGDNGDEDPGLFGPQNVGQSPLLAHNIKVRESTLKAIASIVPFKDEYRKAFVDHGLIPYIVESMNSHPGKPTPKSNDKSEQASLNGFSEGEPKQGYGVNPFSVMIAACGAIRALSRSVSILRTTLIDNGIAGPVIRLLRHSDMEIQIAATAAMCNLVTDISPMRDMITDAGVVKLLCEHAHSMNARLRLNALWALKHFVNAADNSLKRLCVEELGQGWLVQLICDDTEDEALLSSKEKVEKGGYTGEEMDEDVEMDQFEEQVDAAFSGSFGRSTASRPSSSRSKSIQQAELRLAALRDAETNPAKKARKDDIAVQEQGLSFIRNLIGPTGPGASSEVTEMVDFLFTALGQERVFEILASKLRPKVTSPFNRRGTIETRVQPPQPEIIVAVAMILVHMAASVPRHRQIIISQTDLLKLLLTQFHHPNIEVRLALCNLATNLTWLDDSNDAKACSHRATELMKLNFLTKLELLEQDAELNVRERAKHAVHQMKAALGF